MLLQLIGDKVCGFNTSHRANKNARDAGDTALILF